MFRALESRKMFLASNCCFFLVSNSKDIFVSSYKPCVVLMIPNVDFILWWKPASHSREKTWNFCIRDGRLLSFCFSCPLRFYDDGADWNLFTLPILNLLINTSTNTAKWNRYLLSQHQEHPECLTPNFFLRLDWMKNTNICLVITHLC